MRYDLAELVLRLSEQSLVPATPVSVGVTDLEKQQKSGISDFRPTTMPLGQRQEHCPNLKVREFDAGKRL
jgi:hypothetical protein